MRLTKAQDETINGLVHDLEMLSLYKDTVVGGQLVRSDVERIATSCLGRLNKLWEEIGYKEQEAYQTPRTLYQLYASATRLKLQKPWEIYLRDRNPLELPAIREYAIKHNMRVVIDPDSPGVCGIRTVGSKRK